MIESVFVMLVLCLILFGMLQMSQLFAGKEIMDHAANAGVRAKAVGFNDFMVHKVVRVATIPNAGKINYPNVPPRTAAPPATAGSASVALAWNNALASDPTSPQTGIELSSIPLFLGADRVGELSSFLDYEDWDTVSRPIVSRNADGTLTVRTRQAFPLRFPMLDLFYDDDNFPVRSEAVYPDHAALYLE